MSNLVTQADFSRLHKVSRKAVTIWKNRGYLVFSGNLVDVEKSNATLLAAGRAWSGIVTPVAGVHNSVTQTESSVTRREGAIGSEPAGLSAMCDGCANDVAELMLRHLPMEIVRPLVAEFVTRARRGATEILDEDTPPPSGYASWADHPAFTEPPIQDFEWEEAAELAAAHVQARGAAADA